MTHDAARVNPRPSRMDGRSRVRFTRGRTCPVCGGSDDDHRGQGRRCHGFLSGEWAYCAREEHAGQAKFYPDSKTWGHKLEGDCPCGKEHSPTPFRPETRKGKEIDCIYPYENEARNVAHETIRYKNPKGFSQRRPNGFGGYIYKDVFKGITPILYRLPELLAADPKQTVFIVEGEKDVDRLLGLGLLATTNPMGAGKWDRVDSSPLDGHPCIVIADNDDEGRKHTRKVAADRHGKTPAVKILELPGLPEKGDVSDWLDQGGTVEQLRELAAAAPVWSPDSAVGPLPSANGNGRHLWLDAEKKSLNYSVLTASELNIENASAVKIKPIKWLWPYRMAEGEMALVAGEGGLGKSQVMLSIAAAITNGSAWPDRSGFAPKGRVLIVTAEDSKETTIVPRLIAMGADLKNVEITTAPKLVIKENGKDSVIKLQWLEDLDYWRRACDLYPDLKLLIMDPIVSYLGKGVNDQKNDEVRSVIEPFLDEIIKKRGICFLANTHLNKSLEAKNIIHRITGSIAYVNIPRNVHVVFRDAQNPEMRFFAQMKCNNAPDDLAALKFQIEGHKLTSDGNVIETSRPVFSDELVSPIDLKQIMAADKGKPGPKPVKLAEVAAWVWSKLEHGPMTQYDLIDDAREAGHLPPVTDENPEPSKTALYNAVRRFADFVPGWTVTSTTIGKRKAWMLTRADNPEPNRDGLPF